MLTAARTHAQPAGTCIPATGERCAAGTCRPGAGEQCAAVAPAECGQLLCIAHSCREIRSVAQATGTCTPAAGRRSSRMGGAGLPVPGQHPCTQLPCPFRTQVLLARLPALAPLQARTLQCTSRKGPAFLSPAAGERCAAGAPAGSGEGQPVPGQPRPCAQQLLLHASASACWAPATHECVSHENMSHAVPAASAVRSTVGACAASALRAAASASRFCVCLLGLSKACWSEPSISSFDLPHCCQS